MRIRCFLPALALSAIIAGIAGCAAPAPSATIAAKAITFSVIGDSITKADSPDIVNKAVGAGSWITYASVDGVEFAGGWAEAGAQTNAMAAHATPVVSDVLVVLAGTNDAAKGVPFEESARNIKAIVQAASAKRVVVSAIPPIDDAPWVAESFNARLLAFVQQNGWTWVDAVSGVRTADGVFAEGMTIDGVHPTERAARIIGESIRAVILAG
jgi:lysophospholipase L1-like esterase